LLKLREIINMLGYGNCTVYAIMSQLYPQTYGGYRLSPTNKTQAEAYRQITLDKDVQATVKEIRGVAIQKQSNKNPAHYGDGIEESFNQLLHSEYLTVNHLAVLAQHYSRVIVVINTDATQPMTSVYFPREGYEFTASLNKANKDMSAYHVRLSMRFNRAKTVPILDFITYLNANMGTKVTAQTTLYEVIRAVLQLNYCIAYINEGVHSWSLQSYDRNTLLNYIPKPIDLSGVINN
jgi:TorA maturation chaperone TorD